MRRILVYSHDTYGLGNIRRMLAISEHLCRVHQDLSILIVTGSPMLHAFRLSPRIDYVKLPCLTRTDDGGYDVKTLGLDYGATIGMRRQMLTSAVASFEPDLVLVDKKPFGVDEELRPALDRARAGRRPPKLVLLLRDILDDPATTRRVWAKNGYYQAIETHYDSVLVLGSADVFDLPTEYRFPAAAASRVEFCGYTCRPAGPALPADVPAREDGGRPLVLVTTGGGEDGGAIVDCFLDWLAGSPGPRSLDALVVTGPQVSPPVRRRAHDLAADRSDLRVLEFSDDLAALIRRADLVVSMAGYNTICEILSAGTPAVVIPRVRPVREQLIRAGLLAQRGLVDMIHPDQLTPAGLGAAVGVGLASGRHRDGGAGAGPAAVDLGGLERVEKCLAGLVGDG